MRHPFWLINSVLLVCLIGVFLFILFSQQKLPKRTTLKPSIEVKPPRKEVSTVDLGKIYTNDLFGTFSMPAPVPSSTQASLVKPIPQPPLPKPVRIPTPPPPKFLEPLQISLKGLILMRDENKNLAIIEDTKTKVSSNYKVGEKIEDAQLIRILKNKVILIRSNGQQETLYVSAHDAEADQLLQNLNNWSGVIQKTGEHSYRVDPLEFINHIQSLAQLIDVLNLTTVYQRGKSIGCRIGKIEQNSLGFALGLAPGDIITSINDVPATDNIQRFEIYKKITALSLGDTINVKVSRASASLVITYVLQPLEQAPTKGAPARPEAAESFTRKTAQEIEQEKIKILEQQYRFAPTSQEIQKKEKRDMLRSGSKQNIPTTTPRRGVLLESV